MTVNLPSKDGIALKAYLLLSAFTPPLMRWQLKRRIKTGKESPDRLPEKLGIASQTRPATSVIWIHGVGLGEVLALRGLILAILDQRDDLTLLVTSSTRTSAEVFSKNITPNTIHQMLPLDAKSFVNKFLNHWKPDLSIWAEQDLWPSLVTETHRRNIPLVLVNARMNQKAFQSRRRLKNLYRDLYKRFNTIIAQDENTAEHMRQLGATVSVGNSLKSVAIPLDDDTTRRTRFENSLQGRRCWLLATSHSEDEALALAAHAELIESQPELLLIIAPRLISRKNEIADRCKAYNLSAGSRSGDDLPVYQVYIADTFGEMGLWYRVAIAAFIGGSMGPVQGHNPWESAVLDCPIIHGPNTNNFVNDYEALHRNNAAIAVTTKVELVAVLNDQILLDQTTAQATNLTRTNKSALNTLALELLSLLPNRQTSA